MKRTLFFISMLILCMQSNAYDMFVDDVYYNLNKENRTAEVTNEYEQSDGAHYRDKVTIPATVICDGVEYSVTAIHSRTFMKCWDLTELVLPNTIREIGDSAFYDCYKLNMELPNSTNRIGEYTFFNCKKLQCTKLPNQLISIGGGAFYSCHSLSITEIPEFVQEIGVAAFANCFALKSIKIPESVTTICESAFMECKELETVTLPNTLTTICKYSFMDCGELKSINIPASVQSIEMFAFSGCKSLTEVFTPSLEAWCAIRFEENPLSYGADLYIDGKRVSELVIPETFTTIPAYAFNGCNITSVKLPNTITSIGDRAFRNCRFITSIDIPASVTWIGDYAFSFCEMLERAGLPNSLNHLGKAAFYCCENLQNINIPESLDTIGVEVFGKCGFTSFTIPKHVKRVGRYAFEQNEMLEELVIESEDVQFEDYSFNVPEPATKSPLTCIRNLSSVPQKATDLTFQSYNAVLLVPQGCVPAYQSAEVWKHFAYITDSEEECKVLVEKITTTGITHLQDHPIKNTLTYNLLGRRALQNGQQTIFIKNGRKIRNVK